MSSGITAVIVVVIVLVAAALIAMAVTTRRHRLQQQFGPEYDRVVAEQNSRLRGEAELADRQRRVRKLDIKPLSAETRQRYSADWMTIQEKFVDSPQTAVREAYELVTIVMTERGYPSQDDEQVMAYLSVEHAQTVSHFRAAQQITASASTGDAATEDLRQALIHYRALFSDLLGDPAAVPGTAMTNGVAPAPVTEPDSTGHDGRITEPAMRDQADIHQR